MKDIQVAEEHPVNPVFEIVLQAFSRQAQRIAKLDSRIHSTIGWTLGFLTLISGATIYAIQSGWRIDGISGSAFVLMSLSFGFAILFVLRANAFWEYKDIDISVRNLDKFSRYPSVELKGHLAYHMSRFFSWNEDVIEARIQYLRTSELLLAIALVLSLTLALYAISLSLSLLAGGLVLTLVILVVHLVKIPWRQQ